MSPTSIIIPMRNAEAWIQLTLESLLPQTGETEIVVIDDGSTDRSVDVVREFDAERVRIVPGPRRGISAAVNAGLAAARGEYVCRCDADDLYPPDRLAWQAEFLDAHPGFGAVCGSYSTIDPGGRRVADHFADHPAGDITDEILSGRSRSHMCAYLFRTDVLRKIGGCREWFVTSEDADLQFRLAEVTRIWFDPRVAYLYRLHDSSITHAQRDAQRRFYEEQARRFLAQRRAGRPDDLQRRAPPPVPAVNGDESALSTDLQIQELLLGQAWREHAAGERRRAIGTGWRAVRARPGSGKAWRSLAALLIKPSAGKIGTRAE
jgi:glycosyltransferase involved in cell wall biosynthesis